ncbi:MAG: helix-turn-helix transcriptional regulator [Spirochaetia bacterium]
MRNKEKIRAKIICLLSSVSDLLAVKLCVHDWHCTAELPPEWRTHVTRPCLEHKSKNSELCRDFCQYKTSREIHQFPEGRSVTCPFSLVELQIPFFIENQVVGVLFAGRKGSFDSPSAKLLVLLRGTALQVERLFSRLHTNNTALSGDRYNTIITYIDRNFKNDISLTDLSNFLNLSRSRTAHLLKEIAGKGFSPLLNERRLRESIYYMRTTDISIGRIAEKSGFRDPAYFSRMFRKTYGVNPREYRKQLFREEM